MYQLYISASTVQLNTVTKCLENTKFYQFQQQNREKFDNLSLSDLIILPVQRIPRYKLLVQEIVKRTDEKHPDYEGLKQALTLIEQINAENNEKLRDLESRMKVLNITNEMEKAPDLTSASRVFIFSSILHKIKTSNGKLEKLSFYLFNDCMIYASPSSSKGKKCVFKMRLPIDSAFAVQKMKDSSKYKNVFAIYSSLESFMVSTRDDKKSHLKWIGLLEKCITDAKDCYYFHGSSRNAMMGRGSVLISQAPLQLPKTLKKELHKQLESKKKSQQSVSDKALINLLIDDEQISMFHSKRDEIQTRQYHPSRQAGLFSYGASGLGDQLPLSNIAEDLEELSDDEKEFFMPSPVTVSIKQVQQSQSESKLNGAPVKKVKMTKAKTQRKLNGMRMSMGMPVMQKNDILNARQSLKKTEKSFRRVSRDDSSIHKKPKNPPPFQTPQNLRRRSSSFGSGKMRKSRESPFKQPQQNVWKRTNNKKPPPAPLNIKKSKPLPKSQPKPPPSPTHRGLLKSSKTSIANVKEAKVNKYDERGKNDKNASTHARNIVMNGGGSDIGSKLGAFQKTATTGKAPPKSKTPPVSKQTVVKSKVEKAHGGDSNAWNAFLEKHNNSEPINEWIFHKWIKAQPEVETISFKEARSMFRECKGKGRV